MKIRPSSRRPPIGVSHPSTHRASAGLQRACAGLPPSAAPGCPGPAGAIADIDLATGLVQWQGEHDKVGKARVTPLSGRAVEIIELCLANRREEGLV